MIYKEYKNDNYNLYTIKTDKFKSCQIEVIFKSKINEKEITIKNLLVDMLTYSSKKYPKRKDVVKKLEDLYSASLYGVNTRLGNASYTNFIMEFLSPKYCEKDYLKELIAFLFEMIFNPNINNDEFDSKVFQIIKNRNRTDILSMKENGSKYAVKRALINMDSSSPTAYVMTGNLEDLENIDEESLAKFYKEFLKNVSCDIFVIGNIDMENLHMLIDQYYSNRYVNNLKLEYYVPNKETRLVKNKIEVGSYDQSFLILVYNANNLDDFEKDYVIHVFNYIFGAGSLTTKLSKYLREENSMCYTTYSMYQKLDQLLLVYVGTDAKNKDKCVSLIKKSLKEMVNGNFTNEEVENAKKFLVSNIKASSDSYNGILDNYVFHTNLDAPLLKERAKMSLKPTKEDVIKVAKKLKLNTIYMLKGDKIEKN